MFLSAWKILCMSSIWWAGAPATHFAYPIIERTKHPKRSEAIEKYKKRDTSNSFQRSPRVSRPKPLSSIFPPKAILSSAAFFSTNSEYTPRNLSDSSQVIKVRPNIYPWAKAGALVVLDLFLLDDKFENRNFYLIPNIFEWNGIFLPY